MTKTLLGLRNPLTRKNESSKHKRIFNANDKMAFIGNLDASAVVFLHQTPCLGGCVMKCMCDIMGEENVAEGKFTNDKLDAHIANNPDCFVVVEAPEWAEDGPKVIINHHGVLTKEILGAALIEAKGAELKKMEIYKELVGEHQLSKRRYAVLADVAHEMQKQRTEMQKQRTEMQKELADAMELLVRARAGLAHAKALLKEAGAPQ